MDEKIRTGGLISQRLKNRSGGAGGTRSKRHGLNIVC
jgi:hypothetical protein